MIATIVKTQWFSGSPLPLNEWFVAHRVTIDIDGLSMVLVKVNKKGQNAKKHDLLKKT